ncbi:MAG: hypothetical protein M4D80_22935 [Myxococcota bacterium]|nr:hypothetical protein [Myxococcota bacterium]
MHALALVILLTACGGKTSDESYKPVAVQFAQHLIARDFAAAHAMLATPMTSAQLQQSYETMIAPIGKVSGPKLTQTMTDWPEKKSGDAGWAYVAIEGEHGSEAVTVVVTRDKKIRTVEFGRP